MDETNSTVSFDTTHFSKYMVVDKTKWFALWSKDLHYLSTIPVFYDTVLTRDCSGNMDWNDPITSRTHSVEIAPSHYQTITDETCGRIEACKKYVSTMRSCEKAAVIAFSDNADLLCDMTSDKDKLISSLQGVFSGWGTDFDRAIQTSVSKLNENKDGARKIVIFLSDGECGVSDSVLETAKQSHITIYTVGLGSVNEAALQRMASYTGGEYFKAVTADKLVALYSKIGVEKEIDKTDTDGDGLYDIFETAGMKTQNGTIITSNRLKADTDGDGLKDGEEILPEYKYIGGAGVPSEILTGTAGCYFEEKSDPNKTDTDGDGYKDDVDSRPLTCDVTKYSLSNTDFVPIYDEEGNKYYGGNQGWFDDQGKPYKPYNNLSIKYGGCGTVAVCNILAYLESTDSEFAGLTKLPNMRDITKLEYIKFITRMAKNYITPIWAPDKLSDGCGTWGVWPDAFISGIQKYCPKIKCSRLSEDFGKDTNNPDFYIQKLNNFIGDNLKHNVPIPLCTGVFIPHMDGTKGYNTYYEYGTDKIYGVDDKNPLGKEVKGHWVVVTEFKIDNIAKKQYADNIDLGLETQFGFG